MRKTCPTLSGESPKSDTLGRGQPGWHPPQRRESRPMQERRSIQPWAGLSPSSRPRDSGGKVTSGDSGRARAMGLRLRSVVTNQAERSHDRLLLLSAQCRGPLGLTLTLNADACAARLIRRHADHPIRRKPGSTGDQQLQRPDRRERARSLPLPQLLSVISVHVTFMLRQVRVD